MVGQANDDVHPFTPGRFHVVRRGAGATVIAVGPVLDAVLDATRGRDVTVLYANTIRPVRRRGAARGARHAGRRAGGAVAGRHLGPRTSPRRCRTVPHRLLALGVPRIEHRHYGEPEEHIAAHGLDAAGIARSLETFLRPAAA